MQLKIQRSQRQSGVMSKSVVFCIDARIFFNAEEQANVQKYKLGSQVIYSSEAAKRHQAKAEANQRVGEVAHSYGHLAKGVMHAIASRMALNITVDSLQRGQHIECKDLDEVMDAEEALMDACTALKNYLATAATFDGREAVIDFSQDEPRPIATAAPLISGPAPIDTAPAQAVAMTAAPVAAASPTVFAPASGYASARTNWWDQRTPRQQQMIIFGTPVVLLILLYMFGH